MPGDRQMNVGRGDIWISAIPASGAAVAEPSASAAVPGTWTKVAEEEDYVRDTGITFSTNSTFADLGVTTDSPNTRFSRLIQQTRDISFALADIREDVMALVLRKAASGGKITDDGSAVLTEYSMVLRFAHPTNAGGTLQVYFPRVQDRTETRDINFSSNTDLAVPFTYRCHQNSNADKSTVSVTYST